MPSRARLFSLLLLWPALPARAACPDAYNAIIAEALSGYEVELNCDQIRNAAMQLPIRTRDTGADSFAFAGEEDLRGELRDKHGLFIPADRVVLGTLERKSPLGPKMMLVFALHAPRRGGPPSHIFFSLLIAVGTGFLYSLYPASQAAKLDPVEALLYE